MSRDQNFYLLLNVFIQPVTGVSSMETNLSSLKWAGSNWFSLNALFLILNLAKDAANFIWKERCKKKKKN